MQTEVEKEAIRTPEPPENLRGRMSLATALAFFGPGAIIASLPIGSGETVFASRVGAVFGYAVLWTAFITIISKGALVYASNHYITVTGEHPMSRFAKIFPGPRGWLAIAVADGGHRGESIGRLANRHYRVPSPLDRGYATRNLSIDGEIHAACYWRKPRRIAIEGTCR